MTPFNRFKPAAHGRIQMSQMPRVRDTARRAFLTLYQAGFLKEENLECLDILKIQPDLLRKMQLWAIRLGIEPARPRESSAMLCQLSYGGRCRKHGHEFSIYKGGNADEMKGIFDRTLCHLHSTAILSNRFQMRIYFIMKVQSDYINRFFLRTINRLQIFWSGLHQTIFLSKGKLEQTSTAKIYLKLRSGQPAELLRSVDPFSAFTKCC